MTLPDWFQLVDWRDGIDIALVAVVIYNLLLLIRGTRAVQILLGILFLGGIYYVAGKTDLLTLQTLMRSVLIFLPFAMIVLFQQEIRRALARFGSNPIWGMAGHEEFESTINDIVLAATTMATRKIGALIVIQRREGLRNYVENGIVLDAAVSYDLLINLFTPDTPLHDGAVIVQGDRIAAAACFLPLTLNPELSTEFGSRHRAAIGMSEETDALAIVASEETGTVSVSLGGKMIRKLDSKALRNTLFKYLLSDAEVDKAWQS